MLYQIQTLLRSSELWFPQALGDQLYAAVAPSCSPSGTFLQPFVDSGISVLHKKLYHFSAIISLHKEKLRIFWKERRMLHIQINTLRSSQKVIIRKAKQPM